MLSTIKYLWTVPDPVLCDEDDAVDEAAAEAVGGSRRRSIWRRSSARGLPAAAARSRAAVEGSKLSGHDEYRVWRTAHAEARISEHGCNLHSFLQKPFYIVHGDQSSRRRGYHNDGEHVFCTEIVGQGKPTWC